MFIFRHYFEWFMCGFSFLHLNVPQQWKRIIWSTETCRIADKVAKWFSSYRWLWTICSSESPTSANVTSFLCLLRLSHQLDITCLNIQLKSLVCFLIWNRNSETVVHLLKCALGSGKFTSKMLYRIGDSLNHGKLNWFHSIQEYLRCRMHLSIPAMLSDSLGPLY